MANDKDEKDTSLPLRRPFIYELTDQDRIKKTIEAYETLDKIYYFKKTEKRKRRFL